ncbi:MAG: hypothetical protein ACN6OP_13920 [Pseudomonadales bacterium]
MATTFDVSYRPRFEVGTEEHFESATDLLGFLEGGQPRLSILSGCLLDLAPSLIERQMLGSS